MLITIYAAVAQNGVIGYKGSLPWRLSSDLKRFKSYTMGKSILMGKKTWLSLPAPLVGRYSIVLSTDPSFIADGASVACSLFAAIALAKIYVENHNTPEELVVIGGSGVFDDCLPLADFLHITYVLADVEGDVFFPFIDFSVWNLVSSEEFPKGEKDDYPTRYAIYERIKK